MKIAAIIASAMQMMIKYNLFTFFNLSCLIAIPYNKPYALFFMLKSSFYFYAMSRN